MVSEIVSSLGVNIRNELLKYFIILIDKVINAFKVEWLKSHVMVKPL